MATNESYTRTFTSFSGADIVATFGSRTIGELQAIQYSVTREKAPIYTMGSPDPRSFSRGKRGIAGTLVFTQFDRDALIDEMVTQDKSGQMTYQTFAANNIVDGAGSVYNQAVASVLTANQISLTETAQAGGQLPVSYWDEVMSGLGYTSKDYIVQAPVEYSDQIPPFHITITFANEYGQRAKLEIHYVEILNEGAGYSIDDVVAAKSCTFIARKISYLKPNNDSKK